MASALALVWLLFACGVYLPDLGRGFIKDDFRWVLDGTAAMQHPLRVWIDGWSGNFFRPVVALTFGVDHALYGLWARGYGFTNFALYVCCVVTVYAVLRQLSLSPLAAAAGTFAWAINPSGLDMAVLWLSGRTSLLMTLFSCSSLLAFMRDRRWLGSLLLALALASKEDAVAVPIIVLAVRGLSGAGRQAVARDAVVMLAVVAAYAMVRTQTDAITLTSAPDFYRLTWSPSVLAENLLHYLDRAATSTVALVLLLAIAGWRYLRWVTLERRYVVIAAVWFAAGLCITLRVPVRSSLYVVFPSIAVGVLFGALVQTMCERGGVRAVGVRLVSVCAVVLPLIPAYNVRNDRWSEPARVSTRTFALMQANVPTIRGAREVIFEDEPVPFSNFAGAFQGAEPFALKLFTGREMTGRVVPQGAAADAPDDVTIRLDRGRVSIQRP